jgi:hypothetical protein
VFRDQFGVNRREVITTFLRKSIFEGDPAGAREQLRAVPVGSFQTLWKSIVAPVVSFFAFEFVVSNFQSLIDSLFALILVPPSVTAGAGFVRGVTQGSNRLRGGVGDGYQYYFPSNTRNTIIEAGRSRTMVRLLYDGYQRLVEPYKLEYYIRKDGRGLEYFWGWDTSGGKSGKVGIKQFICNKIQSVQMTDISFRPQFIIEL